MFEIITLDFVAGFIFVAFVSLITYLLLNNSSKTSKAISKFLFRNDPVPENKPEEPKAEEPKAEVSKQNKEA